MKLKSTLSFLIAFISTATFAVDSNIYRVQPGDFLSMIAQRNLGNPVFSKNGSLAKILLMNPQIKNPDRIYPGEEIKLQERVVASESQNVPPQLSPVLPKAKHLTEAAPEPEAPAPVLPVRPLSEEVVHDQKPISHLSASAGADFFRIESKDKVTGSTSTLLSSTNPQAQLAWDLDWDENWSSHLMFSYQGDNLIANSNPDQDSISNSTKALYGFEAGAIRRWGSEQRTTISLGYKQHVYEHAPSAGVIDIDPVVEPEIKILHQVDIFSMDRAKVGVGLSAKLLLPGTGPGYSTQTGYGSDLSIYLQHDLKNFSIQGSIYYGYSRQDSSLVQQSEQDLGALFGLSWRFNE